MAKARDTGWVVEGVVSPSGTVTFLFTDVEGSTLLWEQHAAEMRPALARHDDVVRSSIVDHGGLVFSTAGDSFSAAFSRPEDAVLAAVAAQRALVAQSWPRGVELRVRMGIHVGTADERGGDYFGPAVNRAARLMGLAHGGQILVSRSVWELAVDQVSGVRFVELGEHGLRGMQRPEVVFQLNAPGLPSEHPPLESKTRVGNLPTPSTSLVGRVGETSRLSSKLDRARLLTLVGPGGVGKTRLAIEVGAAVTDEFPDGVWLVELAPIADPGSAIHALASVLNVLPEPGFDLLDSVVNVLAQRRALVLLDNCEHLIEVAAEIAAALVGGTRRSAVLATSREPLEVDGEQVWPVGPLDSEGEAATLFVERARAVNPDFGLSTTDRSRVVELCDRLDGIPLAVELAAARTRTMTLEELSERLVDRFRVLRASRRGGGDRRHQTLRATVEWSYQLLDDDERLLLDRLSVFAGTFDATAVERICVDDAVDRFDVEDLLDGLVARSMVQVAKVGDSTRFGLLETMRQYGHHQLADRGELAELRGRHLRHYVKVANRARRAYEGTAFAEGRRQFRVEWDNLREALEFAESDGLQDDANRLVRDTAWYCSLSSVNEHRSWADRRSTEPNRPTPEVLAFDALWSVYAVDYDRVVQLATRAIDLAPAADHPTTAMAWQQLYWVAHYSGRADLDAHELDLAARRAAANSDDTCVAFAVTVLPYEALKIDPTTAMKCIDDAAALIAGLDNDGLDSALAAFAGYVHYETGNPQEALAQWRRSVEIGARAGVLWEAYSLAHLAIRTPEVTDDDPTEIFHSVLTRLHQLGVFSLAMWTLTGLAHWLAQHGRIEAAAHIHGYLSARDPRGNQTVAELRTATADLLDAEPQAPQWQARGGEMIIDQIVAYSLHHISPNQP